MSHPSALAAGQWFTLLTVSPLPEDTLYFPVCIGNGEAVGKGMVATDGKVNFAFPVNYSANKSLSGTFVYAVKQ